MKKLSIAAAAALALASAAPAFAQQADTAADPFLSTQGELTALAVIGGVTTLVVVTAIASGDNTSSTDTGSD